MSNELSPRYYTAEATVWSLGAILVASRFFDLGPVQTLPVLKIVVARQQDFLRVVAVLLSLAVGYLGLEWRQSPRQARTSPLAKVRAGLAALVACTSLWVSYPLLAANTRFAGISPVWYVAFLADGYLLGRFVSVLAFASLMIRTPLEARSPGLARIPAATRAQYRTWGPLVPVLLVAYLLLRHLAPASVRDLAFFFVCVPYVLVIGGDFLWLCGSQNASGKRIPRKVLLEPLRTAFDTHDYGYFLGRDQSAIRREMKRRGISEMDAPQAQQQAFREGFRRELPGGSFHFHVQTDEELQFEVYQKDGDPENRSLHNRGVRLREPSGANALLSVVVIPDDRTSQPREMQIPRSLVQERAEEYVSTHTDDAILDSQKLFSHAINQAVIDVLAEQARPSLLAEAAMAGQEDTVHELLERKRDLDVNEQGPAGWTALLAASGQGHPRIVRLLLDAGADPDLANLLGITPLMFSARYGNSEVCAVLLECGADTDRQDIYGQTALMVATKRGQADCVERLLRAGANVAIENRDGLTALDLAQNSKQGKIATMLRRAGRDTQKPK